MKPLYRPEQFLNSKSMDKLPCECYQCKSTFYTLKKYITQTLKGNENVLSKYCSRACTDLSLNKKLDVSCLNCQNIFKKSLSEIKKTPNHFCSQSCSTTYNNQNKTHGTRRSKLEVYLEEQLTLLYPEMEFHFNRKDAINSELDIFIPELNLAFELNGIFHYEPIYGQDKLTQIQNNDHRKFQACLERGIELCIIDSSSLSYFKKSSADKYLNIITSVINQRTLLVA